MIRLTEKTEVVVTWVETQTKNMDPPIERAAIRRGRPAAASEPKTKSSKMMTIGTATSSALVRSREIVSLISLVIIAEPLR